MPLSATRGRHKRHPRPRPSSCDQNVSILQVLERQNVLNTWQVKDDSSEINWASCFVWFVRCPFVNLRCKSSG